MEAARVAAERRHSMTLLERNAMLGGKLVGAERFAGYHDIAKVVDCMPRQATRSGAHIRAGVHAGAGMVVAKQPDTVISAAGTSVVTSILAGGGSVPIYACEGDIRAGFPKGTWS